MEPIVGDNVSSMSPTISIRDIRHQHGCILGKMIPEELFYLVQLSNILQHFDDQIATDIVVVPNFPQNCPNCPEDEVYVDLRRPSDVVHVGPVRAW